MKSRMEKSRTEAARRGMAAGTTETQEGTRVSQQAPRLEEALERRQKVGLYRRRVLENPRRY